VYDKIALDWKKKRLKPWPVFTKFYLNGISQWSKTIKSSQQTCPELHVDLGSGSGRHSEFFLQHHNRLIDLDISREMLRNNPYCSLKVQASLEKLPFRPNTFDSLSAVATLHHIQGEKNRERVIQEICFTCKPKAMICITVWRFYQEKFKMEYLKQIHESFSHKDSEFGDVQVPWSLENPELKNSMEKIDRFYHLFRAQEFIQLMKPIKKVQKKALGNKDSKDNFFFIGYNEK